MLIIKRVSSIDFDAMRFWKKVDKSGTCWLWTASCNEDGYGRFGIKGNQEKAHRYAWEQSTNDTLTFHDTICHVCDIRNCVRNDEVGTYEINGLTYPRRGHLYKATQPANVTDRDLKGRGRWAHGESNGTHTHPESVARGSRSGWTSITEADVLTICERYMRGESASALAVDFGFADRTAIFSILDGTSWAHVVRPSYTEIKKARSISHPNLNSGPCLDCGTTKDRRVAGGLCDRCYSLRNRRAKGIKAALGNSHHGAKLTDDDVKQIRNQRGITTGRELAQRYGVSPGLITNIQLRKIWTHI